MKRSEKIILIGCLFLPLSFVLLLSAYIIDLQLWSEYHSWFIIDELPLHIFSFYIGIFGIVLICLATPLCVVGLIVENRENKQVSVRV